MDDNHLEPTQLDALDRKILELLQRQADLPLEKIADKVAASKTTVWNRIQNLYTLGVIKRRVVILDPQLSGLTETFFVSVKTTEHNDEWLARFSAVIDELPEIMEAHRLAGEIDYLLKVQVASTREFDAFYKKLIARVDLASVTSSLSMQTLKYETALPLTVADKS